MAGLMLVVGLTGTIDLIGRRSDRNLLKDIESGMSGHKNERDDHRYQGYPEYRRWRGIRVFFGLLDQWYHAQTIEDSPNQPQAHNNDEIDELKNSSLERLIGSIA